jgi:hypothetical protein
VSGRTYLLKVRAQDLYFTYFGAFFGDSLVEGTLLFRIPSSEL